MEMEDLPQELLASVVRWLSTEERLPCHLVSRKWREAALQAHTELSPASFAPLDALPGLMARLPHLHALSFLNCRWGKTDKLLADIVALHTLRTGLMELNLTGRELTDAGIAALGTLQGLHSLNLTLCRRLQGRGLRELAACTALHTLILKQCPWVGNVEAIDVSACRSLTFLDISLCHVVGSPGFAAVAQLPSLTSLQLVGLDQLDDASLELLLSLTSLKVLNLKLCYQITNAGLETIAQLQGLTSLSLADGCEHVSNPGFRSLSCLRRLTSLDLSYSCWEATPEGMGHLTALTELTDLDMHGCYMVEDRVMPYLAHLTRLQHLNIRECEPLTGDGVRQLSRLTALQSLDLCWGFQVTDAAITELAAAMPLLRSLHLSRCSTLTDAAAVGIATLCNLSELRLGRVHHMGDHGASLLAASLPRLTVLELSRCAVTDTGLRCVTEHLSELLELHIDLCIGITAFGLGSLSKLAKLEKLDVSGIPVWEQPHVGFGALPNMPSLLNLCMACPSPMFSQTTVVIHGNMPDLPRLKVLNFIGVKRLNKEGMLAILAKAPNLRKLELGPNSGLQDADISSIMHYHRHIAVSIDDLSYSEFEFI